MTPNPQLGWDQSHESSQLIQGIDMLGMLAGNVSDIPTGYQNLMAPRKRQRLSSPAIHAATSTDEASSSNLPQPEAPVANLDDDPTQGCERMVESAPDTEFCYRTLRTYQQLLAEEKALKARHLDLGFAEKKEFAKAAKYFRTSRGRRLDAKVSLPSDEQCCRSSIGWAFGIYRIRSDPASHWTGEKDSRSTISCAFSADTPEGVPLSAGSAASNFLQPSAPVADVSCSRLGV